MEAGPLRTLMAQEDRVIKHFRYITEEDIVFDVYKGGKDLKKVYSQYEEEWLGGLFNDDDEYSSAEEEYSGSEEDDSAESDSDDEDEDEDGERYEQVVIAGVIKRAVAEAVYETCL